MNQSSATPAFEVILPEPEPTEFEREKLAFLRLLPELLTTHRGLYVAIHDEKVAGSGPVRIEVALRVQREVNAGIYVGLVTTEPQPVVRSGIRRIVGMRKPV